MVKLDELLYPADNEQTKKIKIAIGEDDERFQNNLKLLEKWMECQPHLPKNYENHLLKTYLRGCKHDMEEAKRKLQIHFGCRTGMPELFSNRNLHTDIMEIVLKYFFVIPVPQLTPEGGRVTILGIRDSSVANFYIDDMVKVLWMIGDIRATNEGITAYDFVVFDGSNFTPAHTAKFLGQATKKSLFVAQDAYPFRMKRFHAINAPPFAEKIVGILKMFVKEKLRDRFYVESGSEQLKKLVPPSLLPEDYGGTAPSSQVLWKKWIELLEDKKEWFDKQENVKIIGELPGTLQQSCGLEDSMGVQGSFRKLNID